MLDRAFAKKIRKIGYEAVLHFTDEKLAASLISADTTLKEIEDHLAARNDSKNLLNRGELLIICNNSSATCCERERIKVLPMPCGKTPMLAGMTQLHDPGRTAAAREQAIDLILELLKNRLER